MFQKTICLAILSLFPLHAKQPLHDHQRGTLWDNLLCDWSSNALKTIRAIDHPSPWHSVWLPSMHSSSSAMFINNSLVVHVVCYHFFYRRWAYLTLSFFNLYFCHFSYFSFFVVVLLGFFFPLFCFCHCYYCCCCCCCYYYVEYSILLCL